MGLSPLGQLAVRSVQAERSSWPIQRDETRQNTRLGSNNNAILIDVFSDHALITVSEWWRISQFGGGTLVNGKKLRGNTGMELI